MNKSCFDIGTLQAFLDGESGAEMSQNIALHIEGCDGCSVMLAEIDAENDLVFGVLSNELNTLVPTQRLWERINTTIEEEKRDVPFWTKLTAFIGQNLLNPTGGLVAASLLMVGLFSAFIIIRPDTEPNETLATIKIDKTGLPINTPKTYVDLEPVAPSNEVVETASLNYNPSRSNRSATAARYIKTSMPARNLSSRVKLANAVYMPGEESMVNTIDNLARSVNDRKDEIMRPAARISYERNMAAVDDTIKTMRKQVKRDPKNQAARQVLYSAYQNKIDLLNSVNERDELMASLK